MIESTIISLEAAWELDPVRIEHKLWDAVDSVFDSLVYKQEVEKMSKENHKSVENMGFLDS